MRRAGNYPMFVCSILAFLREAIIRASCETIREDGANPRFAHNYIQCIYKNIKMTWHSSIIYNSKNKKQHNRPLFLRILTAV